MANIYADRVGTPGMALDLWKQGKKREAVRLLSEISEQRSAGTPPTDTLEVALEMAAIDPGAGRDLLVPIIDEYWGCNNPSGLRGPPWGKQTWTIGFFTPWAREMAAEAKRIILDGSAADVLSGVAGSDEFDAKVSRLADGVTGYVSPSVLQEENGSQFISGDVDVSLESRGVFSVEVFKHDDTLYVVSDAGSPLRKWAPLDVVYPFVRT